MDDPQRKVAMLPVIATKGTSSWGTIDKNHHITLKVSVKKLKSYSKGTKIVKLLDRLL